MTTTGRSLLSLVLAIGWLGALVSAQEPANDKRSALEMSKAVTCKKIEGYEKYTLLPNSAITSDEKLQVYYRPLQYKVEAVEKPKPGARYRVKFSQDGRIRKKGEKTVLMKKDKILEYDPTFDDPTERIYLINNVGLKGLSPGEYEYDIILRDELNGGVAATQTVSFTVIRTPKVDPTSKTEEPVEPEGSTGSQTETKPTKKSVKKSRSS